MRNLFLVTVLILVLFSEVCSAGQGLLAGKVIVLDPGHGGSTDGGAVHFGVREADVNLAVGLKLRDRLTAFGATVFMTRTTDQSVASPRAGAAGELQARVDVAVAHDANIFVSLHANAHPKPETAGAITFYPAGRPNELARAIQAGLVGEVGMVDKGVRPANFYVLRNSDVPAALVETGFLTNRAEAALLADDTYQNRIAEGIFKGLLSYFLSR